MTTKNHNVVLNALTFIILFFIGGIIGVITLPQFTGRFFVSGLAFGIFGTGLAQVVFNIR